MLGSPASHQAPTEERKLSQKSCKRKPSWKREVYEQVEGRVDSRASQQAVQCALLGGLGREAAAAMFICPGMCWRKEVRLWAWPLGGGRWHTVLQKISLGSSRTGIAISQWKPWAR